MPPEDASTEILPGEILARASPQLALIGRTLGKFAILERLGQGGSGEVFRAEQAQLGRSAVIKVLRNQAAETRVERFLREAKLASRLDHPYAAHVYAFGAETDGVLWIAMEHVRGITLDELVVKRGAMPAAIFGPLFVRLCEVVHTMHELGIIHRDIKGSNVMVIERAGQLLPKLLDFGIAKADDGEVSPGVETGGLTGHGVTLGSPAYMAPEQWDRPHEVDARADIYALGVLAYRCLCGVLPFQRVERSKLGEAHAKLAPPPLPNSVPPALREVVLRALAKAPEARWATAVSFGEAIQRASGTTAPEAVPPFDPITRDTWIRGGPQPIADAIAHLTSAATTVEVDAALRDLVAITCRWLAVLGLSSMTALDAASGDPRVREHARGVIGRDDGSVWLALARAATHASAAPPPGLVAALAGSAALGELSDRLEQRDRARTAAILATDVNAAAEALGPLEPLLAYELVVGTNDGSAESWQGPRKQNRERRVVWGEPLAPREVALLDASGKVVARLSPLAQVIAPLPSAEPELFLLWRGGRGPARLMAAPWGFERDDEAAGSRLAALSTEDFDTSADPADDRSPYPGLAAYSSGDADHFVGREREVESLANRLVRAPLLAVLGPSGVGKSSFIHAGLMPRLGEHYRILTMRPGRHPMHSLAALPAVSGDVGDPRALAMRLRELGESAQRGVVLVIDQLEELVTLCADPVERTRFAEILAMAADGPSAPVRVVATLRDDFAVVIEAELALRGRWDVFVLATPPPEALRRIITEPARRMAVTVDPRVVDEVVTEIAGRPASLPLLSFTGSLLWQARDREARKITWEAYAELGGVQGALATYADEVYASLARRDQDTVRDLFARLVAADGTRIPAPRADLEQLAGARGVLAHLIEARLLVVRDEDGDDLVEIVHECLAERWPRLARWRSEDAADRALLGDVRTAAKRWSEGRRPDLLWRGEQLAELRRLVARSTVLTSNEREFASASDRAEQRARRVRRGLVIAAMLALAGVAAVMIYLRVEAESSANAAHDAAKLAEDRLTQGLIAQGRRELNDGRALPALAYFGEALRRGSDSIALRQMIAIGTRGWRYEKRVVRPGTFTMMAATPTELVAGDQKGGLHWWTTTGEPAGELATSLGDIGNLKPISGGRLLVAGSGGVGIVANHQLVEHFKPKTTAYIAQLGPGSDEVIVGEREALVIYGRDGTEHRRVKLEPGETGWQPAFSTDSKFVIVGGQSTLSFIDLVTMQRRLLDHGGYTFPAASADGSVVAYLDKDRDIHIVGATGKDLRSFRGKNDPIGLALSATGDRLATYGLRSIIIYDTATAKLLWQFAIEPDQGMFVLHGDDLWTGGIDGTVRRYHEGTLVASLPGVAGPVEGMELVGPLLAVVPSDSSLVMYDAKAAQLVVDKTPCDHMETTSTGIAMVGTCEDGIQHVYIGRRAIAEVSDLTNVAFDPVTGMVALASERISVFDRANKVIAQADKTGPLAFIDADQLAVILRGDKGLERWNVRTNQWWHTADLRDATAIAVTTGGWVVGFGDGRVELRKDGATIVRTTKLAARIDSLVTSADRRWVVAQLGDGGTVVLDGASGEPVRTFAPADADSGAAILDPTGDLVIRPSRGAMTVWERATGDELVWNLDLMKPAVVSQVLADGRIEIDGYVIGVLDIPRDTRPAAELLHDLDCRVPIQVVGSRLEPSRTVCR